MKLTVAILAAGKGTRMEVENLPKVLVPLENKPLLEYVLDTVELLDSDKTVLILGHQKEKVIDFLNSKSYKNIATVLQEQQLGTGHAVDQTKSELENSNSDVLILCGDVPLLTAYTLQELIAKHNESGSALTVLSAITDNPTGYGRIVRDNEGNFSKIVEQKDATESEKQINEINSGTYIVKSKYLYDALSKVNNKNAQGEYYLTDIVEIIKNNGNKVIAHPTKNMSEVQGINSKQDLENAANFMKSRKRNFNILGVQQIAIGAEDKSTHLRLWNDLFGLEKVSQYRSESENVDEEIYNIGNGTWKVELDIMQPLDISKKPAVHTPPLNHIGLWVDDIEAAYDTLNQSGVRFAPGGIRKGASGFDVCFIHPKGNEEFPISGEGILIELVQAPDEIIEQYQKNKRG